jgi:2-oxoglutarate ferredoxin oxidoreductase subunit beta
LDVEVKLTSEVLVESAKHDGTSVTVILQNCVIFNDGTHAAYTDKEVREDRTIVLRHGQPMIFGKNKDKGLVLDGLRLKVVKIGENGITEKDLLVHDAKEPNPGIHMMLVNMKTPDFPVALGVIRAVSDKTYDINVRDQVLEIQKTATIRNVDDLLHSGSIWEVK